MGVKQSDAAKGLVPIAYPSYAGCAVSQRFSFAVPAGGLAAGDIIELGCIPPGCRPVDVILDADDLDSNGAPTLALDVGLMSGEWGDADDTRTCGAEFFSASNVAQAGGLARPTLKTAVRVAASDKARSIGVKIATAAATAAAGTIGLTVTSVA
jgi:hypothetical protein